MDRRKKIRTALLIILTILIVLLCFIGIKTIRYGKQKINIILSSKYYENSDLTGIIEVVKDYNKPIKAKVKIELVDDENNKRINKLDSVTKVIEEDKTDFSIKLPEKIENEKLYLKITSKSGFLKDVFKVPVNIEKNKNADVIISLDKGIYKPGDEVLYRALVISDRDNNPIEDEIIISIYDGNNNRVYYEKAKTSEYGITAGKFNLADEVNSGTYKIVVDIGTKEVTKNFTVNPYIVPKYEAEIISDKENYLIGEDANLTVKAKYFFGEPVTNASVTLIIDGKEIKGLTNEQGEFSTTYKIEKDEQINLTFEIVDSSNYFVQGNKTIYGTTDKYEIEILPEYGSIVRGVDNNIYIVTKTPSGEPIKTVNKIKVGNIKRDVITDDNGIKYFTLTSKELNDIKSTYNYKSNNYYDDYEDEDYDISYNNYYSTNYNKDNYYTNTTSFEIISSDAQGNEINKTIDVPVSESKTIVSTDKNKYNEGEDIEISIIGENEWADKEIYIYKNNEIIKAIRMEDDTIVTNLDNYTGLIDICLIDNNKNYYYGSSITSAKKTIFISPKKRLSIDIKTDSEEYKPKDKLNINVETKDENGVTIDSALLVSILDEAVLNLADNDLSVDNLKIALEDIEFSDGITAADLYADILDKSADYKLEVMLLKQSSNENIISNTYYGDNSETNEIAFLIVFAAILLLGLLFVFTKNNKIKVAIFETLISFLEIVVLTIIMAFIYEYIKGINSIIEVVIMIIISTLAYRFILFKHRKYIYKLLVELVILPAIAFFIYYIIEDNIYYSYYDILPIILVGFLLIVWGILTVGGLNKKLNKREEFIKKALGKTIKGVLFWIATIYMLDIIYGWGLLITLTIYILLDVFIFSHNKDDNKDFIKDGKIEIDIGSAILTLVAVGIIIIIAIFIYTSSQSTINDSLTQMSTQEMDYYYAEDNTGSSGITLHDSLDVKQYENASDSSDALGLMKSKNPFNNIFDSSKNDYNYLESDVAEENVESIEIDSKVEENVRNVFLESLAFIPELVTKDGKANTEINISDNITTWNIQVVGNTKDGRIGSNSKTFKVFKEFFVDFSLPTNSVIGDYVEIPVTVYNYTENDLQVELNVVQNEWSKIGEYEKNISVSAKGTSLVYVPLDILKNGNNKLRVESKANGVSDIVEKSLNVNFKGLEKIEVEASGSIEKDFTQDILFNEKGIEGSKKLKVRLYPSPASEIINGMESMLKLPSGCFEQTSSSLYPDILILKYLKENNLDNESIRNTALEYISKGYQKLLTYEVPGEKGGYSLYGNSPAEPVITAFGLMEFKELSDVYEVDENVINNMKEYLYKNQKVTGEFDYSSTYIGGSSSTDKYAMNAYIIWALSEADSSDSRLSKSINYLEDNLDKITDNYTLALIANVFANTSNKKVDEVIKTLSKNIKVEEKYSYMTSDIRDYYGSYGRYQNIQATALTSIALSKLNKDSKANGELINYIINSRGAYGNWGTTQSSILALKAINDYNKKGKIKDQTLTVIVNGKEQSIEVKEKALDIYELTFDDVKDENTVQIKMKDGNINYEIVKEYYEDYASIGLDDKIDIAVSQTLNASLNVNDVLTQNIEITNMSGKNIENTIVRINIPQGASVIEDSLLEMKYEGKIEKYEYNYGTINIYLRNFARESLVNLQVRYRSLYPEKVTGGAIRVYDYYNPEIQGIASPVEITVNKK